MGYLSLHLSYCLPLYPGFLVVDDEKVDEASVLDFQQAVWSAERAPYTLSRFPCTWLPW